MPVYEGNDIKLKKKSVSVTRSYCNNGSLVLAIFLTNIIISKPNIFPTHITLQTATQHKQNKTNNFHNEKETLQKPWRHTDIIGEDAVGTWN